MLGLCLLGLSWMVDPGTFEPAPPASSLATCARPAIMVVEANTACALSCKLNSDPRSIKKWLKRWENATRDLPERTRSEQEEFQRRVRESFNEHAVAAAELMIGSVHASRLYEQFDWQIIENTRHVVCLEATPRDEMERLFYGSFRINLDEKNGRPDQLSILGRQQGLQTVWQSQQNRKEDRIELVQFASDVPPAPDTFLRTVDTRANSFSKGPK